MFSISLPYSPASTFIGTSRLCKCKPYTNTYLISCSLPQPNNDSESSPKSSNVTPITIPFLSTKTPQITIDNNNNQFKSSRREAIGLALGFGLFSVALHSQSEPAEAADGACEQFTVAPSGLAFCDKLVGYGPQALKGQLIKAHYVGKLENGKVFDSSYNRGKPLTFRVGVGEVIKGWDEGILGGDGIPPMLAGGKRTLKLPPELGYGSRGAGCKGGSCIIPPDSVLLFDVEFISKA